MSLWGKKDTVYSDGTIAISGTTVTGTGTTFNTSGLINEGDVIGVGTGATYGEAVVSSVTNATTIVLKSADGLTGTDQQVLHTRLHRNQFQQLVTQTTLQPKSSV